jgi:hypothetical protein
MNAPVPTLEAMSKIQQYNGIFAQMENDFSSWKPVLWDLGDFLAPYSHEFRTYETGRGDRRDTQIINNAPGRAVNVCVSGLYNGLCDPAEEYVGFEAEDPEVAKTDAAQKYCEQYTKEFLAEIDKSNFHEVIAQVLKSIVAYGTGAWRIEESFNGASVVHFTPMPMGTYYIANNAENKVDQLGRCIQMTARQMVEKFGADKCSDAVRQAIAGNRAETKFEVKHLVKPNPNYREGSPFIQHKAFLSCYYEGTFQKDQDKVLKEDGFDHFPCPVARWETTGTNPWGFGLGHDVLGDARSLQVWEFDIALARELELKPPMNRPASVNPSAVSILPGALNATTGPEASQGLTPVYMVKFNIADATQARNECIEAILDGLWNNIFLMLANDQGGKMTAREVIERAQEKRISLTPISRLTGELLKPMVEIVTDIMGKRGRLPAYPPEMEGQKIKIVWKGVFAKAAELQKAAAIESYLSVIGGAVAPLWPDAVDNIDGDKVTRELRSMTATPARIMRSPEDVQAMRQARAAQAAEEARMAQEAQAAETAKTLASAPTDGKNALTDVVAAAQEA